MTTDYLEAVKSNAESAPRKPRIALMGEFSAGKSTLLNMLLARDPLPVRITATSVPPVWISHGDDAAVRVRLDGTEEPLEIADIGRIGLEDTQFIRLWLRSDALEICDLFDMPGISDPNMSRETWQKAFDEVDSVIWCTHATQAWRQSEAATWEEIAGQTNGNNILVITQFDKIVNERDRARLLARVRKETAGAFKAVFPLALIDAINAADEEAWKRSGGAAFSEHLVEMLLRQMEDGAGAQWPTPEPAAKPEAAPVEAAAPEDENRVMPRRVVPRPVRRPESSATRERPTTSEFGHADA